MRNGIRNREELERDYEIGAQQNTGKFQGYDTNNQLLFDYDKNDEHVTIESEENQATSRYKFFILID